MLDIQITRLIAALIMAVLLGWACYVTAYIKHKNKIMDEENKILLEGSEPYSTDKVRSEKVKSWYIGYRLALVGLIIVAAAVGWAAAYFVAQEHALTWVEDCLVAGLGALIGGLILDKYIIHPIADGSFFEKVEDPMVTYFLENGSFPCKEVKKSKKEKKAEKKAEDKKFGDYVAVQAKTTEAEYKEMANPSGATVSPEFEDLIAHLTFDEKVKAIEKLRKSL